MTDSYIIAAFSREEVSQKMKRILESGGLRVAGVCKSVSEIIRAAADMDNVFVIMAQRLGDGDADDVYDALGGCTVMVAAKPEKRALIENEGILFLPLPTGREEILRAASMAVSPPRKKRGAAKPQRSEEEQRLIGQTKRYLMENYMMTEEQAHRFIQKRSMDMGMRFADTARMILAGTE